MNSGEGEEDEVLLPVARLSQQQIEEIGRLGIAAKLVEGEKPRGGIKVFSVPEWHKNRARPIEHPAIINACIKYKCQKIKLIGLGKLLESVWLGNYGISGDFEGYYFLFDLAYEVSLYFCFQDKLGVMWRWLTGIMGLVAMVEVAQATTLVIANIAAPELKPAFRKLKRGVKTKRKRLMFKKGFCTARALLDIS
jgi:hypothetical protein